jgi:3-hydroxyisobutyrate dehydrogenase-like beta-hydroxyacid dehydrogenase
VAGAGGILSAARGGQIVVDLSTTPVNLTRRLAVLCSEKSVSYVEATVARTRQAAQDGTLSVTHCGELGCGSDRQDHEQYDFGAECGRY